MGVVLCGGQSSRMGSDKGLLMSDGVTWAERAARQLAMACDRVVYSIRGEQQEAYAAGIVGQNFVTDADQYRDIGPLGGLLSVHEQFPENNILLLACDMLLVKPEDLGPLKNSAGEVCVYRVGGFFEPLCAFYSATVLAKIGALFRAKQITASLQKILQLPELRVTSLVPADAGRLKSQNQPHAITPP